MDIAEVESSPAVCVVSQALGTVELLELILLSLDADERDAMRTLILSQRVSRAFHATIKGSSKLQQALYFLPPNPSNPGSRPSPGDRPPHPLLNRGNASKRRRAAIIIDAIGTRLWVFEGINSDMRLTVQYKRSEYELSDGRPIPLKPGSWQRLLLNAVLSDISDGLEPGFLVGNVRISMSAFRLPFRLQERTTLGELVTGFWPRRWYQTRAGMAASFRLLTTATRVERPLLVTHVRGPKTS